jgi:hypothetical protein
MRTCEFRKVHKDQRGCNGKATALRQKRWRNAETISKIDVLWRFFRNLVGYPRLSVLELLHLPLGQVELYVTIGYGQGLRLQTNLDRETGN